MPSGHHACSGEHDDIATTGAVQSGKKAFGQAGVTPKDIDAAQLYDCFTITVIAELEDLGFCPKGEGGRFVEGGRIRIGGELPVTTHGGLSHRRIRRQGRTAPHQHRARLVRENHGGLASAAGVSLEVGKKYALEFAFIDRRAVLALDGRVAVGPADLEAAVKRGPEPRPVRVAARGCRVVVRNLQLFRDVHYTADATDYHGVRAPAVLKAGEFFVLGDNSGNSEDSRKWPTPAVPEGSLIGKPFLIHQPLKLGRVSVGGRERAFQTLDWSRLRWVH